ncbi:O-antigen ligase [uncultured Cocleimonas sp.]|uniref:O-antigen ligase family protein n=1 Tax=uncultured Cocleimonas sp. TaxID=1051587 RepID=UPI002617862E|nr:O-antigen ligase family protein [uncultured Cocleimonas sp.]
MKNFEHVQFSNESIGQTEIRRSIINNAALFLAMFFIFSIPWGNAVWDGLTRIFGFVAIGFTGLALITHGTRSKLNIFHLFVALFGAWLMLSLMWSPDLVWGKKLLTTTTQLLIIAYLITLILDTKFKMLQMYQSYVLGNLVGSGIIIYNYLNGIQSIYYQRYAIPTLDIDGQSIMLTLALPMAAYLATQFKSKIFKIINILAIPTIMFAVFLTGTRTASIVAIIGIAYWLFTYRNSSFRIKSTFVVLFAISIIAVLTFTPKMSIDRILSSGESISSGTLNNRTVIWAASIEQWKQAPLVGNGIGSLGYVLSTKHVEYDSAHNTYIHILTENGIIGLSIYLMMIFSIIYYSLHTPLPEKAFLISLLMIILVSQITQHTHFHKETWFALTMLAIHAHLESKRA